MSFFSAAKRPMMDIETFIKSNSGNSVKYSAVGGEVHKLYFAAFVEVGPDGTQSKVLNAITANVHDIRMTPDKYESCVCLRGVTQADKEGTVINDGSCPFCDRQNDAYSIKNYREELELSRTNKQGKELEDYKKALSSQYGSEMKVSRAKPKVYALVAKFKLENMNVVLENGVPVHEWKVFPLTSGRLEAFNTAFTTAGMTMAGGEVIIKYPDLKDIRHVVGQSTLMPAFGTNSILAQYPNLEAILQAESADFDWECLENSFPEWRGMSTAQAKAKCDGMFKAWDTYQASNGTAAYLEYTGGAQAQPALTGNTAQMGNSPVAAPQMATQAPQAAPVQMPNAGMTWDPSAVALDPNSMFSGGGTPV